MRGWQAVVLWAMVVLGLPCAGWLLADLALGLLRGFAKRRALGSARDDESGCDESGGCAPPRTTTPRGGSR